MKIIRKIEYKKKDGMRVCLLAVKECSRITQFFSLGLERTVGLKQIKIDTIAADSLEEVLSYCLYRFSKKCYSLSGF